MILVPLVKGVVFGDDSGYFQTLASSHNAKAELGPADQDAPHALPLEVDLPVLLLLVAVDDDHGVAIAAQDEVEDLL